PPPSAPATLPLPDPLPISMSLAAPFTADHPAVRDPDALYFLPLGGAGEIGMNLNLYGYRGQWLIIDCGVTFGDDAQPGVDVVIADRKSTRLNSSHQIISHA